METHTYVSILDHDKNFLDIRYVFEPLAFNGLSLNSALMLVPYKED